jgi:hypothetical protein
MLVHIVADDEMLLQTAQLDEKGGIVTKRDVKLLNVSPFYTVKRRKNNGSLRKSRKRNC